MHSVRRLAHEQRLRTVVVLLCVLCLPLSVRAQLKAEARVVPAPPWGKGILPINSENYWNAVECGKLGGDDPPCVFWDAGLCKNDDFALSMYTPYKSVAYEVWQAVRKKQPVPTPNYMRAQQTRITVGITPVRGSKNPLKDLVLKRGGKVVTPVARSVATGDARFTFDYPAFAASADVIMEFVGAARTLTCAVPRSVLLQFR